MKFSGKICNGPVNKMVKFWRGDPDHGSGSRSRYW